jgi:hypothetical protein
LEISGCDIKGVFGTGWYGEWILGEYLERCFIWGAGGLFMSPTEIGYKPTKLWASDALISKNIDIFAKGGQRYINRLQRIDGNNGGTGSSMSGQGMGEITVIYDTQTGTTTVYINVSPNSYWQPPAPYQYNSPTIYQNILRLYK